MTFIQLLALTTCLAAMVGFAYYQNHQFSKEVDEMNRKRRARKEARLRKFARQHLAERRREQEAMTVDSPSPSDRL